MSRLVAKENETVDKRATDKTYHSGDSVLLRIHRHKRGTCPKLLDKFSGPFTIMARISNVNYIIEEPANKRLQTVHANTMNYLVIVILKYGGPSRQ